MSPNIVKADTLIQDAVLQSDKSCKSFVGEVLHKESEERYRFLTHFLQSGVSDIRTAVESITNNPWLYVVIGMIVFFVGALIAYATAYFTSTAITEEIRDSCNCTDEKLSLQEENSQLRRRLNVCEKSKNQCKYNLESCIKNKQILENHVRHSRFSKTKQASSRSSSEEHHHGDDSD